MFPFENALVQQKCMIWNVNDFEDHGPQHQPVKVNFKTFLIPVQALLTVTTDFYAPFTVIMCGCKANKQIWKCELTSIVHMNNARMNSQSWQ